MKRFLFATLFIMTLIFVPVVTSPTAEAKFGGKLLKGVAKVRFVGKFVKNRASKMRGRRSGRRAARHASHGHSGHMH